MMIGLSNNDYSRTHIDGSTQAARLKERLKRFARRAADFWLEDLCMYAPVLAAC